MSRIKSIMLFARTNVIPPYSGAWRVVYAPYLFPDRYNELLFSSHGIGIWAELL